MSFPQAINVEFGLKYLTIEVNFTLDHGLCEESYHSGEGQVEAFETVAFSSGQDSESKLISYSVRDGGNSAILKYL